MGGLLYALIWTIQTLATERSHSYDAATKTGMSHMASLHLDPFPFIRSLVHNLLLLNYLLKCLNQMNCSIPR